MRPYGSSKQEFMDHLIQHCQSIEEENNFAKDTA